MDFKELPDGVQSMILGHVVSDEEELLMNLEQRYNTIDSKLQDKQEEKNYYANRHKRMMRMGAFEPNEEEELSRRQRQRDGNADRRINQLTTQLMRNAQDQIRPRATLKYLNMYQKGLDGI